MNRLVCLVCLAFAVVMFGNMWTSFSRANHARLQVTVMHNDALRHRAYMPRDAWKHEEKQLTVDRDSATRSGFNALWKSGLLAALAVIAWRWDSRRRKRSSYRQAPSYKSTPSLNYANSTGNSHVSYTRPQSVPAPDSESADPCAWHAEADALAKIPATGVQKQNLSRTDRAGKFGEGDAFVAVKPLLINEGWTFIARNLVFQDSKGNAKQMGDVDFVVLSPGGILCTIDAKNWYRWRVTYEFNSNGRKNKVWFTETHKGTGAKEFYPVSRAWDLMDETRRLVERHGYVVSKTKIFMAFSERMNVEKEKNLYGLRCVKIQNLAQALRDVAIGEVNATGSQ